MWIKRFALGVVATLALVPAVYAVDIPSGLVANDVTDSSVYLSWVGTSNDSSYLVYENGAQIGQTSTFDYQVTGLSEGTQYTFTVAGVDSSGNISNQSDAVAVTPSGWRSWAYEYAYYLVIALCAGAVAGLLRLVLRP